MTGSRRRHRPAGLRLRLWLAAALLAVLAIATAAIAVYGLSQTRSHAAEAMAAQRRIEAHAAYSARVNDWMLGWLIRQGNAPDPSGVLAALTALDRLIAEDVAAAPTADEATLRARQSLSAARLRGFFGQLQAALSRTPPGTPAGDAAIAFYAAQAPGVTLQQTEHEIRRRDAALAAMEALQRPLSLTALALGLAAPLVVLALYLMVLRPLFTRLARVSAAAEGLAIGSLPAGAAGHDELGLMLARLRQMARRIDRRRARLAEDHGRLEQIVAGRTADLSAANDRLARIDASRRRFFADVGHELRTPLTVIMGEAELGRDSGDPQARQAFQTIHSRAMRLFRRIEDLLRIARSESGRLELSRDRVALDQVVQAALADLMPLLRRAGIAVSIDLPPLIVVADGDWLRQVFAGIFENAAKYAGRGATVALTGQARDGMARILVRDDGPGLPAGREALVFERFARGGDGGAAAPGFGVGLALARWVVETSGGRMDLAPGTTGGMALQLDLPLWEEG